MTERALIAAARRGEPGAIDRLLATYQETIYRYGMKMCGDREDARDVAQETMLSAARGIGDFRGDAALSSWLWTIARSHCIKHRRRREGEPAAFEEVDPALAAVGPSPEARAEMKEITEELGRAIAALDEGLRDVLVLRDGEGLTAPEVAEVLGISVEAVKSRLHRARQAVANPFRADRL